MTLKTNTFWSECVMLVRFPSECLSVQRYLQPQTAFKRNSWYQSAFILRYEPRTIEIIMAKPPRSP